jgi:hypothetical protein
VPGLVIGRDAELAAIDQLLDGVSAEAGVLVIEGPPGIGKTTLWQSAVGTAKDRGYRVLTARPGQTEAKPAYGGLIDLLGASLDELRGSITATQAITLETALLRGPVEFRRRLEGPGPVAVAVLEALRALAALSPVIVAVDDFQWLDAPSKRVLYYAARRLESEPVGLILTTRTSGDLANMREDRRFLLSLGPLSLGALQRMLRIRLGVPLDRPTLLRVLRASGGNPFYALEIVRFLDGEELPLTPRLAIPLPPHLDALVRRRLSALPEAAQEAVLAAFRLSSPTVDLVSKALALSDHDASGVFMALEAGALEQRGDRIALTHPLLGPAIYARRTEAERRRLSGRLAELPLDPAECAYHRAVATEVPDTEVAALAEAAAENVRNRGAPETAATLLDLAVELTPTANEVARARRVDLSAMAYFVAGDSAAARSRWEEITRFASPGPIRAHAVWRLAEFASSSAPQGFESVPEQLASVLGEADIDRSVRAQIEVTLAEHLLWRSGPSSASSHSQLAVTLAEELNDRRVLLRALTSWGLLEFFSGHGIRHDCFERAMAIETEELELQTEILPSTMYACVLGWAGDALGEAARLLDEKLERASQHGDEASLAFLHSQRCEVAVRQGDIGGAERHADLCKEAVEATGRVGRRNLSSTLRHVPMTLSG